MENLSDYNKENNNSNNNNSNKNNSNKNNSDSYNTTDTEDTLIISDEETVKETQPPLKRPKLYRTKNNRKL